MQYYKTPQKQQGAALFVSLIMLIALTIIGLSAAQRSTLQERMAANVHVQNVAFNAAESAIGGFMLEAGTGNKLLPTHMLFQLRTTGSITDKCYDATGTRVPCGSAYLDGDKSNAVLSMVDAQIVDDCNPKSCGGYSLGSVAAAGGIGCRIYQIDGTGQVGNQTASTSLWAYEVSVCTKN